MVQAEHKEKYYKIGEFSKLLGVSPSTVRRWERRGLLRPRRTPNNTRMFSASDVSFIRNYANMESDMARTVIYFVAESGEEAEGLYRDFEMAMDAEHIGEFVIKYDIAPDSASVDRPEFRALLRSIIMGMVDRVVCENTSVLLEGRGDLLCDFLKLFDVEISEVGVR